MKISLRIQQKSFFLTLGFILMTFASALAGFSAIKAQLPCSVFPCPRESIAEATYEEFKLNLYGCFRQKTVKAKVTCITKLQKNSDDEVDFEPRRAEATDPDGRVITASSAGFVDLTEDDKNISKTLRPKLPVFFRVTFKVPDFSIKNFPYLDVSFGSRRSRSPNFRFVDVDVK